MWIILSIYALFRWSEKQSWKWVIASGILAGIAVLTKAVAAYVISGAAVAMVIYTLGRIQSDSGKSEPLIKRFLAFIKRILLNPQVWTMAVLMIAPVTMYYMSRGDRASSYFSSWTLALSHLLLEPGTYVRWLRLVESLMGLAVLLVALLGVLIARPRSRSLLIGLWIGYFVYGLFLPYQMYTHNYYHLELLPIIALSMVSIVEIVVSKLAHQPKVWRVLAVVISITVMLYTAWFSTFSLYIEDHRNERAYWEEIGALLPSDGKIIGLTQDYGYRLMYYGWRKIILWPPRGEFKLAKLRGNE